jgi:hypothetical protein
MHDNRTIRQRIALHLRDHGGGQWWMGSWSDEAIEHLRRDVETSLGRPVTATRQQGEAREFVELKAEG